MPKFIEILSRTVGGAFRHWTSWILLLAVAAVNAIDLLLSLAERAGMSEVAGWPIWLWSVWVVLIWIIGVLFVRLYRMERDREPRIEIEFKEESPFVITEPFNSVDAGCRLIRVRVRNTSTENIEQGLLALEDIQRDGQTYSPFVPIGMITQHQLAQQRTGGVFNLRGKQVKLIEIAALDERKDDSEIIIRYETLSYPNQIPRGEYRIVLRAYGGGVPDEKAFRLFVDGGRLRMLPDEG